MKMGGLLGCMLLLVVAASSCSPEVCPGGGVSYANATPLKVVHKSSRIKPKGSMIHSSRKSNGRKPPKRNY